MDKLSAIKRLEPIANTCIRVIEGAPRRFANEVTPSLRRDLSRKAVSTGYNSVILSQLAREIPRGKGFSVGTFDGLPGIMDARGELLLRVKQLDKNLRPMNIPTSRQKSLQQNGLFELGDKVSETLVLGFLLSRDLTFVVGIYLFQNKDLYNKEWLYSYRLESQRTYLDLFGEEYTTSVISTPIQQMGSGGVSLPLFDYPNRANESEQINAQLTDLPDSMRIKSAGNSETQTGTDKN